MQDAAPGAHPLYIAGTDEALVAEAIAMMCGAFEHVGDRLDAAVRVVWKAAQRTFKRIIEGKVVEEQEGIEFIADARRNRAAQFHTRAFDGNLRFDDFGDASKVVHVV